MFPACFQEQRTGHPSFFFTLMNNSTSAKSAWQNQTWQMFFNVTFSFEYVKNAVWVHKGWITEEI